MNKKGFTLIELLLYSAISSTILFVSVSLLWFALNNKVKNNSIYEVNDNATVILQYVTQMIQNSNATNLTKGTSAASITLTTKDLAKNPTLISLIGNNIIVTEGASGSTQINSQKTKITNLSFTNLGNVTSAKDSIRVSFTISVNTSISASQYNFTANYYATATLK